MVERRRPAQPNLAVSRRAEGAHRCHTQMLPAVPTANVCSSTGTAMATASLQLPDPVAMSAIAAVGAPWSPVDPLTMNVGVVPDGTTVG